MADNEVRVHIIGDAHSLKAAMSGAADSVRTGVGQMRSSLAAVGTSFRIFSGVLTSVFAGGVLIGLAKQSIQLGDDLNKAAIKAGVSGHVMASLAHAAKMADVDLGSLSASLRFMQKNLSEASSGGKQQLDTLKVLGLTYQQLKALAPEKQFELIGDRISQVKDPADKARAATELFGRAGANLLPLFEQGAAGIRAAREEAERLGVAFTDQQIKRLAEADDAIKRLSASWRGFATTLTAVVAPVLSDILNGLANIAGGDTKAYELRVAKESLVRAMSAGADAESIQRIRDRIRLLQQEMGIIAAGRGGQGRSAASSSANTPTSSYAAVAGAPKALTAEQILSNDQRVTGGRLAAIRTMQEADEIYLNAQVDLQEEAVSRKRTIDLEEVAAREDELRTMADQGRISREQELAGMRQLEDAKYEIERDALAQKVLDISLSEVETQKAYDEFEMLAQKHAHRLHAIDLQVVTASQRNWKNLFSGITAGLQGVIAGFLRGTQSIGDTLRGMMATVLDAVGQTLAQIAAKWLVMKATEVLFGKQTIMAEAAKAGAGGTASMAAAPWPLNMTAPAFGLAMAGIASGFSIASAAGGYDIPANVNPVTQLHAREMVLPAEHADSIRAMGGRGRGAATMNLSITAVDSQDVARALSRGNYSPLHKGLTAVARQHGYNLKR